MERVDERVVQEVVSEVVALCPWMNEVDVAHVETVFRAHVGLVVGEAVDVAGMALALAGLAQRAGVMGDRRRAWAFEQWYRWTCASRCGEEYRWPALPLEVARLG